MISPRSMRDLLLYWPRSILTLYLHALYEDGGASISHVHMFMKRHGSEYCNTSHVFNATEMPVVDNRQDSSVDTLDIRNTTGYRATSRHSIHAPLIPALQAIDHMHQAKIAACILFVNCTSLETQRLQHNLSPSIRSQQLHFPTFIPHPRHPPRRTCFGYPSIVATSPH